MYICPQEVATKLLTSKTENMKTATHYILNTKTDCNFDTNENKFYPASWEPVLEEKEYLEGLIEEDKAKFENCKVVNALD